MIRKKNKFLAVGFNYHEMNRLQDKIADEFAHFDFNFAISVRDSLYRMNISDYQVVVLDLTNVNSDDIVSLKKIYNSIDGVTTFVVLKESEYSKLSDALGINFQYFVLKDADYVYKLVSLIHNVISEERSVSSLEFGLSTSTRSLFQSLINTVSEQVFAIGVDYRLKLVNHEILKKCDCMMEDVIGKRCYEFFYNFDKPCSDDDLPCPLKKVSISGQSCKVIHRPKDDVQLHISAFPLTDEFNTTIEVLIAVNRETKSSEALFDRDLLNSLVNGFTEGLLFCDSENKIQLINDAAEHLFDVDNNQVFGKTIFKIPLGKGLHWLGKVLQNAKSKKSETTTANIHVNEKPLLLRFEPLYRNDDQYIGGLLYVVEIFDKEVQSVIDADIINISKFFSSKVVAEG